MENNPFANWPHEHVDLKKDAVQRLRSNGGRLTTQRQEILDAFQKASEHPTVDEIFRIAREKDSRLNLSTVYRTMRWLEKEGFLQSRIFPEAERSERFDTARPEAHHHFLCVRCHALIEFDMEELESLSRNFERRYGLKVTHAEIVLYGYCASCREAIVAEASKE